MNQKTLVLLCEGECLLPAASNDAATRPARMKAGRSATAAYCMAEVHARVRRSSDRGDVISAPLAIRAEPDAQRKSQLSLLLLPMPRA